VAGVRGLGARYHARPVASSPPAHNPISRQPDGAVEHAQWTVPVHRDPALPGFL